jgi:hypothetical protein
MERKRFLLIVGVVVMAIVSLIGYWHFSRPRPFPSVETSFIMPANEDGILAPDGNSMYTDLVSSMDVRTGAWSSIEIADAPLGLTLASSFLDISPSGRYLTASTDSSFGLSHYLVDVEKKNYQEGSYLCESWSGDSTRCVDSIDSQLIEMPANKAVEEWSRSVDFRKLSNVSGDYSFLWDMDQNIPAAQIYPCNEQRTSYCLVSLSLSDNVFRKYKDSQQPIALPILELAPSQEVSSYIFDPTGRYVLFAVWENKGEYVKGDYDSSTVTDTALVLVDWRTKENKEIFRISTIDPAHVVVSRGSSALQWSSNGSTILISRFDASDVVLKLKYP